jgi:hypothetical protein
MQQYPRFVTVRDREIGENPGRVMTEAEWLAGSDLPTMQEFASDLANDRKLRLLGVAATRRIWHLLSEQQRAIVEAVERLIDGVGTPNELETSFDEYGTQADNFVDVLERQSTNPLDYVHTAVLNCCSAAGAGIEAAVCAGLAEWLAAAPDPVAESRLLVAAEGLEVGWGLRFRTRFRDLLHDLYGNPFRPVTFSPTWRTDTAVSLARQMYESRDFSAMPVLADALQDAGCDIEDILNHCQRPGEHVRGCFVVDLVLAKE